MDEAALGLGFETATKRVSQTWRSLHIITSLPIWIWKRLALPYCGVRGCSNSTSDVTIYSTKMAAAAATRLDVGDEGESEHNLPPSSSVLDTLCG
jgi:hypothetical protein